MRDETRFTRRRLVQMSSLALCGLIAVGVLIGGPVTAADTPGARDAARVQLRASIEPCANNQPPKASFTRPTVATVGQPVTFTSTSTDPEGQQLQHFWFSSDNEFGFKQGTQVTHTFTKPGRYHVRLQVRDSCGATSNAEVFIDVLEPAPPTPPQGNTADNQPAQIPKGKKVVVQQRGFLSYVIGRFLEHVRGTATFTATNVGGSAARPLLLGRKRFEAQPGRVVRVRVKLPRRALRALKRRGRLRVRGVVRVVDDGGNRSFRTTNITLKARR